MMSIAFFGEALYDCYSEASLVDPVQAMVLQANIGGGVLNAAIGAKRWLRTRDYATPAVSFIGGVSGDAFGRRIIALLQNEEIDTAHCHESSALTALAIVMNDPNSGERSFAFHRHHTADLNYPQECWDADWFKGLNLFACDTNCMTTDEIFNSNLTALGLAQNNNIPVAMDINLRPALWGDEQEMRARVRRALCYATLIKSSAEEFPLIFNGTDEQHNIAQLFALSRRGALPRILCISRGADGCSIYFENKQLGPAIDIPAVRVDAIDTTGAGDAFFGTLCASIALRPLSGGKEDYEILKQAAAEAVACAAHTVQHQGALSYSLPSLSSSSSTKDASAPSSTPSSTPPPSVSDKSL